MRAIIHSFAAFTFFILFFGHITAADFRIEKLSNNVIGLQIDNLNGDEVKISIEDQNGYRVHSQEVLRDVKILKRYKLDKLPLGKYKLKIERNLSILVQPFNIKHEELAIDREDQSIIYKPSINYLKGNMYVDFFQLKKRNTTIQLFDEGGNSLLEEKFKIAGNVQRKYNVAKLRRGNYTVYVKVDGEVYTKKVAFK